MNGRYCAWLVLGRSIWGSYPVVRGRLGGSMSREGMFKLSKWLAESSLNDDAASQF